MASVDAKVKQCPRCSQSVQPVDQWFDTCGYCAWPLWDVGIECVRCKTLNSIDDTVCDCGRQL